MGYRALPVGDNKANLIYKKKTVSKRILGWRITFDVAKSMQLFFIVS